MHEFVFGCAGSSSLHTGFSLVMESRGYSLAAVLRLLITRASLVESIRVSIAVPSGLYSSVAVVCGLSCFAACGLFTDQGLNPCLLPWQADSLPLSHQGRLHLVCISLHFPSYSQHA